MKAHSGFVQGIAWDPLGQYLSSQSADGSLKIWSTSDWSLQKTITKNFGHRTLNTRDTVFLRGSWTPDGEVFIAARGFAGGRISNQSLDGEASGSTPKKRGQPAEKIRVHVSPVFVRETWDAAVNFAGHKQCTTVAVSCFEWFLRISNFFSSCQAEVAKVVVKSLPNLRTFSAFFATGIQSSDVQESGRREQCCSVCRWWVQPFLFTFTQSF